MRENTWCITSRAERDNWLVLMLWLLLLWRLKRRRHKARKERLQEVVASLNHNTWPMTHDLYSIPVSMHQMRQCSAPKALRIWELVGMLGVDTVRIYCFPFMCEHGRWGMLEDIFCSNCELITYSISSFLLSMFWEGFLLKEYLPTTIGVRRDTGSQEEMMRYWDAAVGYWWQCLLATCGSLRSPVVNGAIHCIIKGLNLRGCAMCTSVSRSFFTRGYFQWSYWSENRKDIKKDSSLLAGP